MHISLSHSIVLTLAPHLLMACAWNIFIYPYIIMFVVVCAVHIFAHVSISYWTSTRVLIHAPILSQCHYHILHSLISILHLINIFYALSIYLSFLVCYLLWPISKKHVCMFVSPKWETNHHFHCCCVCAIDAKMHYCKKNPLTCFLFHFCMIAYSNWVTHSVRSVRYIWRHKTSNEYHYMHVTHTYSFINLN